MGVLLQGFYKLPPNNALPSPADGDTTIPWWWDHLAAQANTLRLAGFTAVWLPPVLKTASGASPGADGYGVFDDYDLGSRQQKGSLPTRYGSREQLQRCAAILRANGLDIYLDAVEHQRDGDTTPPFVFRYPGANGTPQIGRFPKNPSNFLPQVPRDPDLGGPAADDFPFGRELAPINAKPPHYVFDNLIAAADWLTRTVDAQGYRLDDVKGLSTDFLLPFLNSRSMNGKFAVGEFFDGNRLLVNGWIFNPKGMQGRPNAFDFPLKFLLNAMCNNPGRFNMSDLDHAGLVGLSPMNAVTFVENHDTDLNSGEKIVTNKVLGYAYILTSEGYPCVYYRDYSTDKNCFGLKPEIDNLIWIHEMLANGTTQQRWKDFDVFAYERMGGAHLLVGLNNDPTAAHTIHVDTGFGANVALHDYTGHGPDVTTDGTGSVTITVPQNINGLGYICYSRDGQGGEFATNTRPATQDFEGAADLDILPAINGKTVSAGRIWCAAGSALEAVLDPDSTGWTTASKIDLAVLAPDGSVAASETVTSGGPKGAALHTTVKETGFHTLQLAAANMPAANLNPSYKVSITYTATQTLAGATPAAVREAAAAVPRSLGQWSAPFTLANVAIHAHLLPSGKVLYWGRRKEVGSTVFATLNEHDCSPFVWDPATNTSKPTSNRPAMADGTLVNLFCSGHTFLPDGRLMVTGGHLFDGQGVNQTCIYNPATDSWTAEQTMNNGRWYPTAVTLPDGGALVCAGTFPTGPLRPPNNDSAVDTIPQVWNGGPWQSLADFNKDGRPSLTPFPRMHVAPDGRVFMSGGLGESFFFDPKNGGTWTAGPSRASGLRDYAPSVMYDAGKVIFIGGGLDSGSQAPTNIVEIIDLNAAAPVWQATSSMHFARRQHNATILPDGTVLVTGGTQGAGFNNLAIGDPIRAAELWDPNTKQWTVLAEESVDRCYHSTAVLLPDGRVLSAGGGEYAPTPNVANPPQDSHADAQLFSPPYLFNGPRPSIGSAPNQVAYGKSFEVVVAQPEQIARVSWIRLASVTHSFDQNQRINFLAFTRGAGKLTVTAPANANICPPGHYMLFVLNEKNVPSVAHIVQISSPAAPAVAHSALFAVIKEGPVEKDAAIVKNAKRAPITVGITPTCPYGISACWGGAHEALQRLDGIDVVRPIPNAEDSTAYVYLKRDGLPDLDLWPDQFAKFANGSYGFRGVEMTLQGSIEEDNGLLTLAADSARPAVVLAPLQVQDKIQWNLETQSVRPVLPQEEIAYRKLSEEMQGSTPPVTVRVTGPLKKNENGFFMEVRQFDSK
ncbi:MAG: galactose oxidase-like domain-containing protein [Bryobacteraceae bacterium]|jgi:hypothetical protein